MSDEVLSQLKSLQHPELGLNEAQKMFVMSRGKYPQDCAALYHPGKDCLTYKRNKLMGTLKVSLRIHLIGALIPELIRQHKNLYHNFFPTIKKIVKQFIMSTAWLVLITSFPAISMCHIRHLTGGINYHANFWCYLLANAAWLLESKSKQTLYVGYLMPRNLIVLYGLLINRGYFKEIHNIDKIMIVLACGAIGMTASRGHFKANHKS